MQTEELDARLREAGYADTAAVAVQATIRPSAIGVTSAETLDAPQLQPQPARPLPRLSVDTRRWHDRGPSRRSEAESDLEYRGVLGEGGMGRVFLARQHSLDRDVAVKTTRAGVDAAIQRALLAEGAITGRLEHPAIVPVHALGLDASGSVAMVMKRIEGVPWSELAADAEHPGWEGWSGDARDRLPGHLQILTQVCNAVHYAHSRGVVHRDIKLENVLIGRFGDVYLADWGVAGVVGDQEARLCGTPGYMAPEMVLGGPIDARTDVYLLGATLHEILTGEMRHEAHHAAGALLRATRSEPYSYGPNVPDDLAELLNRACHRDPDERPLTAQAFRDEVATYLDHRESAALAAEARDRLAALERLLERDTSTEHETQAEIDRLVAEVRFGLERALAGWRGDAPTHQARARLEAILQRRAERAAALERDAQERDPSVGAGARAVALLFVGLVAVATTTYAVHSGARNLSPLGAFVLPALLYAATAAGTFVYRERILATAFGRQIVFAMHCLFALLVLERALGFVVPTPAAVHFTRDSLMMAAGFLVASAAFGRWLAWIGLTFLVGFLVGVIGPEYGRAGFTLAGAAALFIAAGFQWSLRRRASG